MSRGRSSVGVVEQAVETGELCLGLRELATSVLDEVGRSLLHEAGVGQLAPELLDLRGQLGALLAQTATTKTADPNAAAVARGKTVFQQKCSVCHYDNSEQKKIGPGLKGLSKRGTFSVNGNKITDESLKAWIENGDQLMPPFKDVLEPAEIKDVIAYVKTL